MNEQSYEEYIRSILGYPNTMSKCNNNVYDNNSHAMSYRQNTDNSMLEDCYPEIYKIVYPMITKSCANVTRPITRETIENMTDEIYSAVEVENEIGINITLKNNVQTTSQNRNVSHPSQNVKKDIFQESSTANKQQENRGKDRQFRNRNLRDLIQILIIRELLGRPGFPIGRPPFPPHRPPMRPPFPGGPGPRPPFMPRSESYYEDLYE